MADVDDWRAAARHLEGWGKVADPGNWIGHPSTVAGHLTKSALEVEKLRKEVKLLRARNAWLVSANLILALILVFVACGSFMAAFLIR